MKPFDLEKARGGAKVCTRNGYKVEILRFDVKNPDYPIVALITDNDGIEICQSYTKDGKYDKGLDKDFRDLVMTPVKHKGWINIYSFITPCTGINIYPTKELAISKAVDGLIDTICIEWEE